MTDVLMGYRKRTNVTEKLGRRTKEKKNHILRLVRNDVG